MSQRPNWAVAERGKRYDPAGQARRLELHHEGGAVRLFYRTPTSPSSAGKNEGLAMPRYEFMCEKCKKPFELIMTFSEREKSEVKCPKCQGTKVVPQFSGFVAQTSKKS
jgi:putative FmdB family regulatory protein